MSFTAVILAGGQSRRMGSDKAWLEYGGRSLLARAIETVRESGAGEVLISGRPGIDYSCFDSPVLVDLEPGFGPLGGIERGLQAASFQLVLCLAVDLPKVRCEFLRKLHHNCGLLTGVVPKLNGRLEPLAAFYPKRCHVLALQLMRKFRPAAREFAEACLREHAVRCLPVNRCDFGCFENWNEPNDALAPPLDRSAAG